MPSRPLAVLAAALFPLLGGCAMMGATLTPQTPLERELEGTYEGVGTGLTGRVPYRLTLSVQEREGRASGALINLESRKAYALTGTLTREAGGPRLTLRLFENGDNHRGNAYLQYADRTLRGTLRTVLLGRELLAYDLELRRTLGAAPVSVPASLPATTPPAPAPATPLPPAEPLPVPLLPTPVPPPSR